MADETLLVLSSIGVPPYSARGLTQTLEPIDAAANLKRTINGALIDLSVPELRKYRSTISGADVDSPAFDQAWPGLQVVVDCIAELSYLTNSESPNRPVVAGSSRVSGDFTFYRPQLTMRVVRFAISDDEWMRESSWTLELEEV